ncbi:MAG: S8 family serine peptidase [Caulobacteraceae bacterium]
MKKTYKKLFTFFLIISLIASSIMVFADSGDLLKEPELKTKDTEKLVTMEKNMDYDGNKLFDILETKLGEASDSDKLPVVVMYNENLDSDKKAVVEKLTGQEKPKHEFITTPGMAVDLTKKQIQELSKQGFVKQIEYDLPVYALNDEATYWFGVQKAVSDFGADGDMDGNLKSYSPGDIVVAVIDTGIDTGHVDLDGGKVIGWMDFINGQTSPYDDNGHGTHCSSIAAGEGDGNPVYKGVAPGAALVGVKVLDSQGSGYMSDVTAGIDWVTANKDTYGVEIISLSLGTSTSSDGTDSTSLAVNNAFNNGIVVCVAAGNSGPAKYTIGSPGAADKALTVAAMADAGEMGFNLAYFSSRGPTADGRIKPDIASPGYNITAAKAGTVDGYVQYSGTSMATPFTAGTVALMLDANPGLTPTDVVNTITNTAEDWGPANKEIDYGFGRLDAYEAVKAAGGFSSVGIETPAHLYGEDSLSTRRVSDYWEFNLTDISYPIAITLIMTDWTSSTKPDFDIYLYNPNNTLVKSATGSSRQETINFTPTMTGKYTIRVYSYAGSGNYYFDLSAGGESLILTTNN